MIRLVAGAVVLDRYRIVAPSPWATARGEPWATACGEVLALDQRLGQHVDLVLAPQPLGTPLGDLFRRRAHAVAVLQHPSLPPVLDLGLHEGHVALVYRHAEGRSLSDVAAHDLADWTARRALQLVADLAAALGLAHAQGLHHGSFGAPSVLLEREGMATIRDLAWPYAAPATDRADVAPEVQRGQAPTPRADVYALGQVLRRLMRLVGHEAGRGLDAALRDVVLRATAPAPRERYADGAALARAIGALLAQPSSEQSCAPATPSPPMLSPATVPVQMGTLDTTRLRAPTVTRTVPSRAAQSRPRMAAAPVARHPAALATRRRSGFLPAVVLGLSMLLPLTGVVAPAIMSHVPFAGFHLDRDDDGWRPGWHGWQQARPWPQWQDPDSGRAWGAPSQADQGQGGTVGPAP